MIVGHGPEESALKALAHDLRIEDRIIFAGFRSDIPEILSGIDILAHPSLKEGIPNAIMEAMAMGIPAVSTDTGGTKELVSDGETGLIVPTGDTQLLFHALIWLLDHEEEQHRMGKEARNRIIKYFDRQKKFDDIESLPGGKNSNA